MLMLLRNRLDRPVGEREVGDEAAGVLAAELVQVVRLHALRSAPTVFMVLSSWAK